MGAKSKGKFRGKMISSCAVSGLSRKAVDDQAPYHAYGAFLVREDA